MLTWDDVVARDLPCAKCQGTFRVRGQIDRAGLAEIRHLLETGQPISAIRFIRELTGAALRDAKGMYEHVTIFRGNVDNAGPVAERHPQ
jgi:ribosomal protein L7/L12